MSPTKFTSARRAVEQYMQTDVLQKDLQKFPVFLRLLIQQNKQTTSAVLQTEQGNNTTLRFFIGFPIAMEL